MPGLTALLGTTRYELLMQVRRRALWIAMAFFCPLLYGAFNGTLNSPRMNQPHPLTAPDAMALWALVLNLLSPVAVGLMLADRFPRDRQLQVDELLRTIRYTAAARIFGKYLGNVLAALVPILVIYAVGVGYIVLRWSDPGVLPLALGTFAAIVLPTVLFVGAFSIACPTILWTPLYQFLFVGYWMWINLNPNESVPTLNGTLFAPTGFYALSGFFNVHMPDFFDPPGSTAWTALANIAVLFGCGTLALFGAWRVLVWQDRRR